MLRIEVWFSGEANDSHIVGQLRRNVEKCLATRLDGTIGNAVKCDTKGHSVK